MVFFPRQISALMLNGNEQIGLAAQYLPISGVMLIFVDFLFVFRSGVQGMSYPLIPMCSGILEMVLRIGVIIIFVPTVGFTATAWAEAAAWFGAVLLNGVAFAVILRNKTGSEKFLRAGKKLRSV